MASDRAEWPQAFEHPDRKSVHVSLLTRIQWKVEGPHGRHRLQCRHRTGVLRCSPAAPWSPNLLKQSRLTEWEPLLKPVFGYASLVWTESQAGSNSSPSAAADRNASVSQRVLVRL